MVDQIYLYLFWNQNINKLQKLIFLLLLFVDTEAWYISNGVYPNLFIDIISKFFDFELLIKKFKHGASYHSLKCLHLLMIPTDI